MITDDSTPLARMIISANWDAGFQLQPRAEPLPDVSPGGEYVVECAPQRSVMIREIVVHDFQLVQISTATRQVRLPPIARGSGLPRAYHLDAAITVPAGERVIALLKNDTGITRKQKVPLLVREDAAAARIDRTPIGRAEDAVRCPACGKAPGDSCEGPASHPSRFARYAEYTRQKKD
jgi:hypothetical protein